MEQCKAFLKKTECHFNWHLSQLDVNPSQPILPRLKDRLDEKEATVDSPSKFKWPLRLTYGYELFSEDPAGALECVEQAIREILASKEGIIAKYRESFLHTARSTKAFILMKTGSSWEDVEAVVRRIKPKSDMDDEELAALVAEKAFIFRFYGPDGTTRGIPLLREAIRRNPEEAEWKISLVVSLNRRRHVFKGSDVAWDQVEETVNILEELLLRPDLTETQTVQCKYYLAVAYYDYSIAKPNNDDTKSCREEILRLCDEICDKTDFTPYLSFCAERFAELGSTRRQKGTEMLETLLGRFPTSVSINIAACKIRKRQGDLVAAGKHAQIALDNGCYGGAWLWVQCKTKLKEEFDEEEFFHNLLRTFQRFYRKQTFLNSSMYYFFVKRDPVYGAHYMASAIAEDPDFDALRKPFFAWYLHQGKVRPIEVAYNQIVLALRNRHSREDFSTLNGAKIEIEQVAEVEKFAIDRNLVEEALRGPSRGANRNPPKRGGFRGRRQV